MKLRCYSILMMFVFFSVQFSHAQMRTLRKEIENIVADKKLKLGFSFYDFQTKERFSINGDKRFPMQSVYKFPIALAVLNGVDKGNYRLSDSIVIEKKELHPETWSPIRDAYPDGVSMPLEDVIRYTVARSDNNASDILLSIVGGADKVQNYVYAQGVRQIQIVNTEYEIQSSWDTQFQNWTTPNTMVKLLKLFNDEKLLKSDTQRFLWEVMSQAVTGSIKNHLPSNVEVAHKTGYSGYGKNGVIAAVNDVGVIVLPDGRRLAIAIFITDSMESSETNYSVIAQIGLAIYQNYIDNDFKLK